ncbi:MAG TPA: hypothetical protein VI112_13670 [Bacteroidia bacterium]
MKRSAKSNVPPRVSAYLKKHFNGAFYKEVTPFKDVKGHTFYKAEISHNNSLYHLKFDRLGALVKEEVEPLMELLDEDFGMVD